ncbi:putative formin-like protein 3-like [Capsicum annuum]|nr:putative formin-like protein 3-like [Capsicum annuum]KAF3673270.1 putative formin-like protein 3-like [Capsicum annuum]
MIPDDINRAVGSGARDIVNYCGFIMRTTISFRDGNWQKIVLKHGEAMWLRVRDKFEVRNALPEHKLQGFMISTMQRLFRTWKARLHVIYSSYENEKDRLSHRPKDVELDDWNHLVEYFGTDEFKRNPLTGENETPDKIWEIKHTRYGKKPPKRSQTQQANIEAIVSSAVESMRQEMQLDMERKLQEEREQMTADLKRQMDQDLQKKLEEEREHMKGEVEKIFQEKMVALMVGMQQVFS